jgi:hypothetical protein
MLERVLKARGVEKLFGMNVLVEGIALGLFGMLSHLPGLELLRLFHLDESRHTGLPRAPIRLRGPDACQRGSTNGGRRDLVLPDEGGP